MENYKDIPNCAGYRAHEDGSIWSCWKTQGAGQGGLTRQVMSEKWKRLKGEPRKGDGRLRFTLRQDDGSYRRTYGYIFILEAFIGRCPVGKEACHGDGNCTNDAIGNLRWGTPIENKNDMVTHGTRQKGEQINTAKLTEADVREIRKIGYPLKQHAVKFGVTTALISMILRRKTWKHVE